jgi:hypothetical protein
LIAYQILKNRSNFTARLLLHEKGAEIHLLINKACNQEKIAWMQKAPLNYPGFGFPAVEGLSP